jgi:hypothetical protein
MGEKNENHLLRVAEGLQILAKYSEPFDIGANHDVIHAGPMEGEGVSEEDQAKLKALGWTFDNSACGGWSYYV